MNEKETTDLGEDSSHPPASGGTNGFAFSMERGGEAIVPRYGVAYAFAGGTASAGATGVAVTKGGVACSGDGGVSVAHLNGRASCGANGVAYSSSPDAVLGFVRGSLQATLVIAWVIDGTAHSRSIRVGDEVDGCAINPGVWYTLDADNGFKWKVAKNDGAECQPRMTPHRKSPPWFMPA